MRLVLREERDAFGHHVRQRAAAVMFEMPFLGNDMAEEPFELLGIVDQLAEQRAKLPLEQHPPDIEHHCGLHAHLLLK